MNNSREKLEELQNGKSSRIVRSLRKLNELLESLFIEGNTNFSISHVGRLSKAAGGVSESSIRIKTGEHYRDLINFWKEQAQLEKNKNPISDLKKFADKEIDIVNKNVENIAARSFIYTIIAERDKLRKIVKSQEKIIKTSVNITAKDLGNDVYTSFQNKKNFYLDPMEINVLKDSIGFDYHIVRRFWDTLDDGSVLDEHGDQIYKMGYVNVIKKIIEFFEEE